MLLPWWWLHIGRRFDGDAKSVCGVKVFLGYSRSKGGNPGWREKKACRNQHEKVYQNWNLEHPRKANLMTKTWWGCQSLDCDLVVVGRAKKMVTF